MKVQDVIHKLATDQEVTKEEVLLILTEIIKAKTKIRRKPIIPSYLNYN